MLEQQKKMEEERSKAKASDPGEAPLSPCKAAEPSPDDDKSESLEKYNEVKGWNSSDAIVSAEQTQNPNNKQRSPERKTSEDNDQDVNVPPIKRAKPDESSNSS